MTQSRGRPTSIALVAILFSLLPISTTIFAVCVGAGTLMIVLPLSDNNFGLAGAGFLFLAVILGWLLAPLAYRFLARAFPLNASGRPNRSTLRVLRILLIVMSVICVALVVSCWSFLSSMIDSQSRDVITGVIVSALSYVMLSMLTIVLLGAMCLTLGLLRMIALHRRPAAWTAERFVLFLRSFGSVSDTAAIAPLMRAAGALMRVALLSSPGSLRASWNPLTLALAGFSFRHPFRSVPVFLESTDETWSGDVKHMADSASVVVIDITHRTPGLSQEIEILSDPRLSRKTVRFREVDSEGSDETTAQVEGAILLTRSPLLRRWSQVTGFIFTYAGFVTLTALLVSIFDIKWSAKPSTIILWSSLAYSVIPALWGAAALAPAAGFTRRSATTFVEAVRHRSRAAEDAR